MLADPKHLPCDFQPVLHASKTSDAIKVDMTHRTGPLVVREKQEVSLSEKKVWDERKEKETNKKGAMDIKVRGRAISFGDHMSFIDPGPCCSRKEGGKKSQRGVGPN